MNIIIPHVNYTGRFVSNDIKYQLITYTDTYMLYMVAITEKDGQIVLRRMGSHEDMNRLYEKYKDNCVYATLRQIRVLGDGSRDSNVCRYKTVGRIAPDGFDFE